MSIGWSFWSSLPRASAAWELLANRTGLSVANASHHLQQLRRGGLVVARRDGKFVLYRLSDDAVLDLVAALRRIASVKWPRSNGSSGPISATGTVSRPYRTKS